MLKYFAKSSSVTRFEQKMKRMLQTFQFETLYVLYVLNLEANSSTLYQSRCRHGECSILVNRGDLQGVVKLTHHRGKGLSMPDPAASRT